METGFGQKFGHSGDWTEFVENAGLESLPEKPTHMLLKSTTLSYTWLLCLLKSSFVTFREGIEDFTVDVQFLRLVQNHFCTISRD